MLHQNVINQLVLLLQMVNVVQCVVSGSSDTYIIIITCVPITVLF